MKKLKKIFMLFATLSFLVLLLGSCYRNNKEIINPDTADTEEKEEKPDIPDTEEKEEKPDTPDTEEIGVTEGLKYYIQDDDTYIVSIGDEKNLSKIVIPSSYNGKKVTAIKNMGFKNLTNLKELVIPKTVTSIKEHAFYRCINLTSVTFKEESQIASIGEGAFLECSSLKSIVIPSSVATIGPSSFSKCSSLANITFAEGSQIASIGDYAFDECSSLTSIIIPSSVTSIGSSAFRGCGITNVYYNRTIDDWCNITFSDLTSNPMYYASDFYILDEDKGVIEYSGKKYSLVTKIVISEIVTSIGSSAFSGCSSITSITFEEGSQIASIGDYAFNGCSSLTNIVIPSSVTSIGEGAFYDCSNLESIEIPSSVTSIGPSSFRGCSNLESVEIPNSVTRIGDSIFSGCSSLTSIIIPFVGNRSGVTSSDINQYPFGYIFGGWNYIGGSQTTQYYYGSSTSSPKNFTFYIPEKLKSVTILGGNILLGAFYNCSNLESIEIPSSVTSIEKYAFYNCSSLTSIEIPSGVTSIGEGVFYNCSSLESIEIPSSVTSVKSVAFYNCSSLTSIIIPSSITIIEGHAFYGCRSLTAVYYAGTSSDWSNISIETLYNSNLINCSKYYYSEEEPTSTGNYWHYVDGVITIW